MQQLQTDSTPATSTNEGTSPATQSSALPLSNHHTAMKPRVWSVFLAAAVTMVAGFVATGLYLAVVTISISGLSRDSAGAIKNALENPNIMIPSFALMGITTLFVTAACCWFSPDPIRARLSLHTSNFGIREFIAAGFLVMGISIASGGAIDLLTNNNSPTLKLLERHMRTANSSMFVLAAFIIAGLAPLAEEVFFRGYMQTRLRHRWGATWAIVISAIAFGLFHADPIQTPFAIPVGLALGFVAERASSIRPAIAWHIINNLVAVIGNRAVDSGSSTMSKWITVLSGIVAAVCAWVWFRFNSKMTVTPQAIESTAS